MHETGASVFARVRLYEALVDRLAMRTYIAEFAHARVTHRVDVFAEAVVLTLVLGACRRDDCGRTCRRHLEISERNGTSDALYAHAYVFAVRVVYARVALHARIGRARVYLLSARGTCEVGLAHARIAHLGGVIEQTEACVVAEVVRAILVR